MRPARPSSTGTGVPVIGVPVTVNLNVRGLVRRADVALGQADGDNGGEQSRSNPDGQGDTQGVVVEGSDGLVALAAMAK